MILRELVAEAVRIMLEANGLEGMADECEMADSLIASLGLEPSWYVPTTKCDDGAYRGGHSFASEAQVKRYLREVTPGAEVWKSWAMPPVRISLDAQECRPDEGLVHQHIGDPPSNGAVNV